MGDLETTRPTHPFCTHHTPQARITLTLQDFTNTFTESNLNNYKKLVRIYGFKLEGGELFKEGFYKLLSLE